MVSIALNYIILKYWGVTNHYIMNALCYFIAGGLIYLYKDQIEKLISKYKLLYSAAVIGLSLLLMKSDMIEVVVICLFSLWIMGCISFDTLLLSNRFTHFISGISFEIYLCHLVIFRLMEKFSLTSIMIINPIISYIVFSIITLIGACMFAYGFQLVVKQIKKSKFHLI